MVQHPERHPDYSSFEDVSFDFDSDRKVSLDLRLPERKPDPSPLVTIDEVQLVPKRSFWGHCRPIWLPLTAWLASALFTVLYSLFIHKVLIRRDPKIGVLVFEASVTNLLLSVFSQLYAMVLCFMLSPATDWFSVLKFILDSRLKNTWGIFRLALPFMGLGFGSVLKFQNSFQHHFIPDGPSVAVYAGTIPPDVSVLDNIPASYMAGFFDTWAQQLMNYPRYSTAWSMEGCEGNCSAIFLPGGMEIARKVVPLMNSTILQGGTFNDVDSISIMRAPGLAARFDPLPADFRFDIEKECAVYLTPAGMSDGLQMCIRQVGDSLAAGWRACPSFTQLYGECPLPERWATAPLRTKTLMTVYRQNATTTYDRSDLSIKHVTPTSKQVLQPMSAPEALRIWRRIFIPTSKADLIDRQSINVTIHRLAWKYRTYTEFFPDHDVPVEQLRNFLAVPLQFGITALQYANYTMALPPEKRAFPPELLTVATGGRSIMKFVGPLWTAWVFIVSGVLVIVLSGCGFWYILMQAHPVPRPSGILEVDFAVKLEDVKARNGESSAGSFSELTGTISERDVTTRYRGQMRLRLSPPKSEDKVPASGVDLRSSAGVRPLPRS
ncbi:conserved hypothetical protein [Verticillium alfalfae VaMs.102]|uniref:Uncharacterized protein n=1 Tax=Verticillium alfalfae (strain VaMs.102 / ATCC MYA-4576 / FGSC 10136) TaxID=526221 RepID=C9SMW4_VERA1|nr:conserved hypothetical protein [Verticillium alfalfae VaMs.102]EEY20129.1 conserved hypothetical protein [Verticillium alfalfae VaMs.102]